jgi:hypothetical protein
LRRELLKIYNTLVPTGEVMQHQEYKVIENMNLFSKYYSILDNNQNFGFVVGLRRSREYWRYKVINHAILNTLRYRGFEFGPLFFLLETRIGGKK